MSLRCPEFLCQGERQSVREGRVIVVQLSILVTMLPQATVIQQLHLPNLFSIFFPGILRSSGYRNYGPWSPRGAATVLLPA